MKNVIAVVCLIMAFSSCYNDKADKVYPSPVDSVTCNITTVTYAATIKPIFSKSCNLSGCHDGNTPAAIYDFTSYDGIVQAINNDRLIGAIEKQSGFQPMPQTGAITACEKTQIETWVNAGHLNN